MPGNRNRFSSNRKKRPSKRRSSQSNALTFERFEDRRMLSGTPGPDGDTNDQICEPVATIINGQTVTGAIGNGLSFFDVDLFELSISSSLVGKEITFTLNTTDTDSTPLDTYLRLFDDDGNELEDDEDGGVAPGDSLIDFTFSSSGTYYLGVSASGNQDYSVVTGEGDDFDSFSRTGGYALTFEDTNDQIDEASTTLLDGSSSGNIDLPTDVDVFRWDGIDGQSIRFEVDGNAVSGGGGLDTYLRIFDDSGNELASDDDGGTGFRDSELTFTFDDTKDFYIGVSNFENTAYDIDDGTGNSATATNTGSYSITATEVSLDPDDRISNAIDLGNLFIDGTGNASGDIDSDSDVDLYKFVVGRDGSYVEIDVDVPTLGLDSLIRLFDANGAPFDSNEDANAPGEAGAFPRDSFLGRFLLQGTYYVGVSGFQNDGYSAVTGLDDTDGNSTGSYTIDIQDRLHVDTLQDVVLAGGTLADNDLVNALREAIEFANGQSDEQTITFSPSLFPLVLGPIVNGEQTLVPQPGTITLSDLPGSTHLEITDDLIIDGPGADVLSISGDGSNRVFLIDDGDNNSEIDVTIRGVTVRDGDTAPGAFNVIQGEEGAGIKNTENLTLDQVTVTGNTTRILSAQVPEKDGGGIFHSIGTLLITDSTFSDNDALNGGAIAVGSGSVTIDGSTISDNFADDNGGGILVTGGSVNVVNGSSIELNTAFFASGGGISATSGTLVNIDASTVSGNDAFVDGGGISISGGTLNVLNGSLVGGDASVVSPLESNTSGADGGGIFADANSVVTIDNSTVSGNIADDNGGGISISGGTLNVENGSTLGGKTDGTLMEGNRANGTGGGAVHAGDGAVVTIDNSTVSGNIAAFRGGGLLMIGGVLNVINGSTLGGDTAAEANHSLNDGGAIVAGTNAVVTIDASTVSGNIADDNGGGIFLLSGTLNVLNGSTLGGDLAAEANQGNLGGAIFAQVATVVTIDRSTIAGNTARLNGGGLFRLNSTGSTTITNSTFSGNSAVGDAGALSVSGPTVIRNSTFTGNRADSDGNGSGTQGGIFSSAGQLTMHNTIVAGNFKGTGTTPSDLGTANLVAGSSHNLIGSAVAGSGGLTDGVNGNIVGVDWKTVVQNNGTTVTLADNGGQIPTIALLPGGPAIDAGDNAQVVGTLVRPSSVTTNTANDFRPVSNLISNDDFTDVNFDATPEADNNDSWVTDGFVPDYFENGTVVPVLGFSLGSVQSLEKVAIWGYKEFADNDIKDFTLEFSTDGGATFNGSVSLTKPKYTAANFVNVLELGGTFQANFVRMTISDNHNGDRVGFHEIRFLTEVTDQRGEVRIFDGDGNGTATVDIGAFESDVEVVATAPVVTNVVRDEGGVLARPDLISTFAVTFDQDVTVSQDDLFIVNGTLGTTVDLSSVTLVYDSSSQTATWSFGSLVLNPAFYTFQLSSDITGVVGGLALDGNGDGTGGDNQNEVVYVALSGDANLDGTVDVLGDAAILVNNLGTGSGAVWAAGDFNADGAVDVLGDAAILVNNLGNDALPMAVSSVANVSTGPVIQMMALTSAEPEWEVAEVDAWEAPQRQPIGELVGSEQTSLAGSQTLDVVFAGDDWLI